MFLKRLESRRAGTRTAKVTPTGRWWNPTARAGVRGIESSPTSGNSRRASETAGRSWVGDWTDNRVRSRRCSILHVTMIPPTTSRCWSSSRTFTWTGCGTLVTSGWRWGCGPGAPGLKLDVLLAELIPAGEEEVFWPAVAAILTIARFCEPSSELHIADTWYRRTALPDLLGVTVEQVHTRRLYEGLDALLPHKEAIEKHLKHRLGDLFDLKYDLLLYDVTSTYFEGQCQGNPMAKRGHSRDNRPDCPQVCIGLVVTTDGIPLGYEVFDGNTNDSKTVEDIVKAMEGKYGQANRVWVMDRGMVSEKNLAFLRGRGGSYIVGTPKAMLRQFEQHLTNKDWHEVQAGVEVKLVSGAGGDETFVLARSTDRREKEKAMHDRFLESRRAGREPASQAPGGRPERTAEGRGRRPSTAGTHQGTLLASGRGVRGEDRRDPESYRQGATVDHLAAQSALGRMERVVGGLLPAADESQRDRSGHAVEALHSTDRSRVGVSDHQGRTGDPPGLAPETGPREGSHPGVLCGLRVVENARPMDARGRAGRCSANPGAPGVEEFAKIKSGDVVRKARRADGQESHIRLRCVTTPDKAQKVLLHRLGLTLPQRLRTVDEVEQM